MQIQFKTQGGRRFAEKLLSHSDHIPVDELDEQEEVVLCQMVQSYFRDQNFRGMVNALTIAYGLTVSHESLKQAAVFATDICSLSTVQAKRMVPELNFRIIIDGKETPIEELIR